MPTTCSTYSGTCLILSLRLKNPRRPPAGIRGGITNNMQTPRTDTRGRNVGAREPSAVAAMQMMCCQNPQFTSSQSGKIRGIAKRVGFIF
jgi:hypothetical protein